MWMLSTSETSRNKLLSCVLGLALLAGCVSSPGEATTWTVAAAAETEAALGDPDDPALWISPTDPAQGSRILGTDKGYGLLVFDLEGRMVQKIPSGRLNNVDLRGNLAFASNRTDTSLSWYRISPEGVVTEGASRFPLSSEVGASPEVYGLAAYESRVSGELHVFVNFKNGLILQYRVKDDGSNLSFTKIRSLKVASQPEGMVADDELGILYVGEEDHGLWRFDAEPEGSPEGFLVDKVGSPLLGFDDVEGLGIYPTGPGKGFLIVSSQGTHSYAVYRREGKNDPVGSFRIITGNGVDNVSETDGLEVTALALGSKFPRGILVVQDDKNEGFTKNFKIVSMAEVLKFLPLSP